MSLTVFSIWTPWRDPVNPYLINAMLTNDNAFNGIPKENEFAKILLHDIGVLNALDLQIVDWRATAYRSLYYSEHRQCTSWFARWTVVWRVSIQVFAPIQLIPSEPLFAWTSMESDVTDFHLYPPPSEEESIRCLMVTDFDECEQREKVIEITKEVVEREENHHYVKFTKTNILGGSVAQLQIDLGIQKPEFYDNHDSLVYRLMNLHKENKGTIHYSDRSL